MNRSELLLKLEAIFKEVLSNNTIKLSESYSADDVEGWDSLTHLLIVSVIESEFKIKFGSMESRNWKNIEQMLDSIETKLNKI